MHPKSLSILDFRYDLPEERIAKKPLPERDASRLLVWKAGQISDSIFRNLPDFLEQGNLLVFNETQVIRARILFPKATGSVVEIFCLEPFDTSDPAIAFQQKFSCRWKTLIGKLKRWKEP